MTMREILDSLGPHSVGRDAAPLLDHAEADEAHILALLRKRELATPVIEAWRAMIAGTSVRSCEARSSAT